MVFDQVLNYIKHEKYFKKKHKRLASFYSFPFNDYGFRLDVDHYNS